MAKALRLRAIRVTGVPSRPFDRHAPDMRRLLGLILTSVLTGVVAMAIAAPGAIPAKTVGFTMLVVLVFADAAFIAGPSERVAILVLFTGVLGVFLGYAVGAPEDPQEGAWAMASSSGRWRVHYSESQ